MATNTGGLGRRAAAHLLGRLGFGPRPGDIDAALARGLERFALDQIEAPSDPDLETRLRPLTTLGYPISQLLAINEANQPIVPILDEFALAKVIRAAHGKNQLQEGLVDFWFNHFNVYLLDGFARYSTPAYERDAIRPHALGRFRDLLAATAAHPAMLYYLDNYVSTASRVVNGQRVSGLNENYGRELLELHTVGVEAGYSQEDVVDAARCFTGWGIDSTQRGGNFVFRAGSHDRDAKRVFGLEIPAGGLKDDGDKLIDHLSSHPATARFVSRRLVQRFVADDPPASVVSRCADRFLATGGDIREVMRALVGTQEFWAGLDRPTKPRTPFEYTIAAIRAVDGQVSGGRPIAASLANMGMPLFQCLPPTGYTNMGIDWLNPSSQLYRINFGLDVAAGAVPGVSVDARGAVRRLGGDPEDPASIATAFDRGILGGALTPSTREALARVAPGGPVPVATRVAGLFLASPEMQGR